jgi:hypothetical protein
MMLQLLVTALLTEGAKDRSSGMAFTYRWVVIGVRARGRQDG